MSSLTEFQQLLVGFIDGNTLLGGETKQSLKDCIYSVTPGGGPGPEEDLLRIVQADRDIERRNSETRQNLFISGIMFCSMFLIFMISLYLVVPILDYKRPTLVGKMVLGGETKGLYKSKFITGVLAIFIIIVYILGSVGNSSFGSSSNTNFEDTEGFLGTILKKNDTTEFSVETPEGKEVLIIFVAVGCIIALSVFGIKVFVKGFRENRKYFEAITSKYDPNDEFQYEQCKEFENLPVTIISFGFMCFSLIFGIAMCYIYIDQLSSPWYLFFWICISIVGFFGFSSISFSLYRMLYYNIDTKIKCDDETLFIQPQNTEDEPEDESEGDN